ncbi:MAG TPA: preprotein translocase subunit SecG [Porphyromonadaceae bacterium]|jgi:preprotein translocase subunit SecG|uniref:preprotein translocase subunit SecG n=1 Tax=Limibacterium fermenti TaxID=3229863 RepID=UPI000E924AA3|nr:preprotein translocase subunit SecG [Porphyromonadaceae bacterium]HBL35135.1 preprotein translocase subunit SecG [Porphyromonadaceae bacterium]HBX19323.1 preprotein translocase subunit SecG [Porphyromonadaceae bacterium]HBX45292.1 preprotein translocase subunit SecG [Porphyromonadaceae bacterium]HCM20402.1 preprotein translocase subunit SecG [Porphyromonadaceae bacterium]
MYIFLTILILIAAVLMVLIVLVQKSKGGGLAAGFSSSNQIMGVRKTTDFLEKTTWTLAAVIMVLSVLTAKYTASHSTTAPQSQIEVQQPAPLNPTTAPDVTPTLPVPAETAPAPAQ